LLHLTPGGFGQRRRSAIFLAAGSAGLLAAGLLAARLLAIGWVGRFTLALFAGRFAVFARLRLAVL
jgi:hypothetical protein